MLNKNMFINRELSWLEFNQRVLDEAADPNNPLLERVKFLAITASNLDEFFMVRVGGLQLLISEGIHSRDHAGLLPEEQMKLVSERVQKMVNQQYELFDHLVELLRKEGISFPDISRLSPQQSEFVEKLFKEEIMPVLNPIAVDSSGEKHAPVLQNLGLNLCIKLRTKSGGKRYAIIPLGTVFSRTVRLPPNNDGSQSFIFVEELVKKYVDSFFYGEVIDECVPFRITRNAAINIDEEGAADFMEEMENVLVQRKVSECIRLEIGGESSQMLSDFLIKLFKVSPDCVYRIKRVINLASLMPLTSLDGFDKLRYEEWKPVNSPEINMSESMFDILSRKSVLLCHPYQSYEPVLKLIEEAASDKSVLAIKQTLYRVSPNSRIVAALKRAAEAGKYVTVVVELKARFDEARNISWAKELERAGVQVIYGVKGYKVHSKILLIVRKESSGIVRYMHFGTGNYNENTARIYSDISYMTKNNDLGLDTSACFNAICGYSEIPAFLKISMSPGGIRDCLLKHIDCETKKALAGEKALIMAKMNSLVDDKIISALYNASQAGVTILLNVRGICCLNPSVKPYSTNIKVISIVDRYLEHSRIFYFYNGGKEDIYISSADWMPRNFDRRVEVMIPIEEKKLRQELLFILSTYFRDNVKARIIQKNNIFKRVQPGEDGKKVRSQEELYRYFTSMYKIRKDSLQKNVLEPLKPAKDNN